MNTISANSAIVNGADGIRLRAGAVDNTIKKNVGVGNSASDGTDLNVACDNNAWAGNVFGTVNDACVGP